VPLELLGPGEQHLALVREMPEEGSRGHAGPVRDVGDGRAVVAVLGVQRHRRLAQPSGRVGFPPCHADDPN
jgi:hypothetical protein